MSINNDFATAIELTGAAQAAAQAFEHAMPLAGWLPFNQNPTLNYSFDASDKTPVDVAQYRAFDTAAPYGRLGRTITKSGKLPAISKKLPVSEYTELQYANQLGVIGDKLVGYAEQLGVEIAARVEIARVQAVITGKVVLDENGLVATIDYGRRPELTVPLPAANKRWSDPASQPVDQLLDWRNLVKAASNGVMPTAVMMSSAGMNALATNKQIISFALGRTNDLPGRVSTGDVMTVLAGYAGLTQTIVATDVYSAHHFGQVVWPDGQIVLLPPSSVISIAGAGSLGTTDYGVTAESIQPEYGIPSGEQSGIFAGAFGHSDPEGLDVLASAVALPLVQRANTTLGAKVLAEPGA